MFDPSKNTYALVTSTTYGSWLPGDSRGYVDEHDQYGTPFDLPSPGLEHSARTSMKQPLVLFAKEHADIVLQRWQETVGEVNGELVAVAVMPNHFHFVVVVAGSIDKSKLLQFFKGRASRALNKRFGKQTWWTDSGSVRFSFDEAAFHARIEYVKRQAGALVVWENPHFR